MSGGKKFKIKIVKNGPYLVSGGVPLSEQRIVPKGAVHEYQPGRQYPVAEEYALCRCGHSKNAPYCDGSHQKVGFRGTETASKEDYADRAQTLHGPDLLLTDDNRCALALFCHGEDGDVWELTKYSDDPRLKAETIVAAVKCPTGRLAVYERDGTPIEPDFSPAIEILQDLTNGVSGPIFVKGGIPIESADGFVYEVRNRAALCRCGKSEDKPFCDATHVSIDYRDKQI